MKLPLRIRTSRRGGIISPTSTLGVVTTFAWITLLAGLVDYVVVHDGRRLLALAVLVLSVLAVGFQLRDLVAWFRATEDERERFRGEVAAALRARNRPANLSRRDWIGRAVLATVTAGFFALLLTGVALGRHESGDRRFAAVLATLFGLAWLTTIVFAVRGVRQLPG